MIENKEILKEVSKGVDNALRISKRIDLSIARIDQRLKILEAYGILESNIEKGKIGKPIRRYKIKNPLNYAIVIDEEVNIRKISEELALLTKIDYIEKRKIPLLIYVLKNIEKMKKINWGIVSTEKMIELLVINDHLKEEEIEGEKIKIFNYTYNHFLEGINKKDMHFIGLIKVVKPIHDPNNLIKKLKEEAEKNEAKP